MSGFARKLQRGAEKVQSTVGSVLAQDGFDRADGTLGAADIGGTWSTTIGTYTGSPVWEIANKTVAVAAAGGTNNWLAATLPVTVPIGTVFCDVYLSPANANTGICMRASADGNTYLNVQLNESVTYDRIALSKRAGGATTWLQQVSDVNFSNGSGYSLAAVFTANTVMVYVDGVNYINYALTSQDLSDLSGDTYTGLRSWFGPSDDDGGSRWDRFLVTNATSVPAARVPAAPWNVTATNAGSGEADISWSRAGSGGSALTGYLITSSDGYSQFVGDPTAASFHATGLNNVAQTFTVQAMNAVGYSDANALSARSNSVTPAAASVPAAPTSVTATVGDGQAPVSWVAPANNGGATITGYTVTSNPGNITAATTGNTNTIVTGLTNGMAYTFTVTATNSAGTGPASSPSNSVMPAAPSNILYGPDGTEWPANTAGDGTNFDATVSSLSQLNSALAVITTTQANNGYRIGLSDGDYAPSATVTIPAVSALSSASKAVLVRAVNPGQAKFSHGIIMQCDNVALAYVELSANFKFDTSTTNTWLVRTRGKGAATINVSGGGADCGLVGCCYPDGYPSTQWTLDGDRIHISPKNSGSPGPSMDNFSIVRSWFEGVPMPSGGTVHSDMVQIDGLYGTFACSNSYFGPAGDNGNPQAKADIFDKAQPFCSISYNTCALAGAYKDGQGNASNQGGPHTAANCLFYDVSSSMAFRFNSTLYTPYNGSTTPNVQLTNCTFWGSINGSGTGFTNTNPTMHAAQHPCPDAPSFVKPPWSWW